jgi:type II secretory pathway component GspD/PulD (secretin)
MRTRTLTPGLSFALLAALSAVGLPAQQPAPAPTAPVPAAPAPVIAAPPVTTTTPANGQPADATLADKPAAGGAATATGATKAKSSTGSDTLSVDFPDTDIREILRNVADLFELNLVMPDTLQGKTTIKFRDVTWRQIFQSVLDPVGYAYQEEGNIIKIVSKETLNDEPVTTDVFLINYARAQDILPTISSLVDTTKGKIVVDARSNSLVITERPTRLSRIRPIIEKLDKATDQVVIESKFVEVTDRDIKNIGVNWASLANINLSAGPLNGTFDRTRGQTASDGSSVNNQTGSTNTTNNSTNNGTTNSSTQTSGSTNSSNVASSNGTPATTSSTGTNAGLDNSNSTTGSTTIGNTLSNTISNTLNGLMSLANTGATNRSLTSVFSASQFNLVLSALQSQNNVKIVSNPTIVTLNNSEASINVGEEDPIPNYAYNEQRGSFEVNGFNYKPIGVLLKVTPQVNQRGDIKLTLSPEVSQPNGSITFGGAGGATIPIVATRKATTTVSLRDGYTMGIGGLLRTQETKDQSKVPLLGSVPVLGRLFRSDSKNTQTSNLIIFITAKTLSADGAPVEQVFDSESVRQLNLRRRDLPGYRDGSSPFIDDATPAAPAKTSSRTPAPEAK